MGIRINKALGWVLVGQDVDYSKLTTTLLELKEDLKEDKYLHFDLSLPQINLNEKLSHFVLNASLEYDSANKVFIFIPPFMRDKWHRYDDSMDYYSKPSLTQEIHYIDGDLYPFYQHFVVTHNLNKLPELDKTKLILLSEVAHTLEGEEKVRFEALGVDFSRSLKEQIHMTAPKIIEHLVNLAAPGVDYQALRPALVYWWS